MQIYEELKNNKELWELFTRKEEYHPIKSDKYNRFLFKYSQNKDILYPHVSDFLVKKGKNHINYPENKKFAVVLTHDIDDYYISNQHLIRSLIPYPFHRDLYGFKPIIKEKLKGNKKPYNTIKQIVQLERKYDAQSSFYFFTNEKDVFGIKYKIEEIQDDLDFILDNGCEIGLHTSYYAYDKIEEILKEKEKLEKFLNEKVKGVRNHLLSFNIPKSWEILSKAGFEYDTTLGYHNMIGFRNGMCHPFKPINLKTDKPIEIVEIPLCVSDVALFSYMKKNAYESWEIIKQLINTVEKLGGVLTILWHNWTFYKNVTFSGLFGKEWTKLYEKILEYCQEKNALMTSCNSISKNVTMDC